MSYENKIAISLRGAASLLFREGRSEDEVRMILSSMKQPAVGYVYTADMPKSIK